MGDEVRRTQRGNNNAYCHDDETSWFDWTLLERHDDVHRFVKLLVSHRLHHLVQRGRRDQTLADFLSEAQHSNSWHQTQSAGLESRLPQSRLDGARPCGRNASRHDQRLGAVGLRSSTDDRRRALATMDRHLRASPDDICEGDEAPLINGPTYLVQPRSIACLLAQPMLADL